MSKLWQYLKRLLMMAGLLLVVACSDEVKLYSDQSETDANQMVSILIMNGIDASRSMKDAGKFDLMIADKHHFAAAVNILKNYGYPIKKYDTLCSLFPGDGMVSTPVEIKAKYTCGISQELSRSLTMIDGIIQAEAHIVLAETDPISRQKSSAKASIILKHKAGMNMTALLPKVKRLVSNAVDGMDYENVTVILSEEQETQKLVRLYKVGDPQMLSLATPAAAETQRQIIEGGENLLADRADNQSVATKLILLFLVILIVLMAGIGLYIVKFAPAEKAALPLRRPNRDLVRRV